MITAETRRVGTKTYKQLRCIWAMAHKLEYSPDALRDLVNEIFPETEGHLSLLTSEQAARVIDVLKKKLGQLIRPYRFGRQKRDEPRPFMSPAQHDMAVALAIEIGHLNGEYYVNEKAERLLYRLAVRAGAEDFYTCSTRQAAFLIEALKQMRDRKIEKILDKS